MNKSSNQTSSKYLTWIHCFTCFELLIEKKQILYLLNCQHVLCKKCLDKVVIQGKTICPKCKKPVNCAPIDNEMPKQLKKFFNPDAYKDLSNLFDVIPFQIKHRDHFLKICDSLVNMQNNLEEKLKKKNNYLMKLSEERNKLARARMHCEETIQLYRRSKTRLSPEEVVKRKFATSFQSSHSSGDKQQSFNNNYIPSLPVRSNDKNYSPFDNLNHRHQLQNDNKNCHFRYDERHRKPDFVKKTHDISKSQKFFPFCFNKE